MKIVIAGGGEVGYDLARRLSHELHDVTLIESDPERADFVANHLDIMTVVGNGASLPVLEEAGTAKASMFLAVTSRDEANLIASLSAHRMGVGYTVARVSNPEYFASGSVLSGDQMGIDLMINPERECARETFDLLRFRGATDVATFAGGRVLLIGVKVEEGAPVVGKSLSDLVRALPDKHYVTAAVVRDGETLVPTGEFRFRAEDRAYLLTHEDEAKDIFPLAGHPLPKLDRVMIAGGSEEGRYLAQLLEEEGVTCIILDRDRKRCRRLSEDLPKSLVLHGDATDLELLELEGAGGADGFVAATGNDETNILSSLCAKALGTREVVSLVHRFEYLPIVPRVGINASVSPRLSTANAILRYVRRGQVTTVATLADIEAEVIEFHVSSGSRAAGKTLAQLHMAKAGVVGTVIRGERIFLPHGEDRLLPGDEVIVFALPGHIGEIERLFD